MVTAGKAHLLSGFEVQLEQFVSTLLEVEAGLYGQVDGAAQSDQVCLRVVQNGLLHSFLFSGLFIATRFITGAAARPAMRVIIRGIQDYYIQKILLNK